jgi:hypothetical protein
MKLTANKRISTIERKAAPLIRRTVGEIERKREEEYEEEIRDAHYWRYIDHYYPEVANACRKAIDQAYTGIDNDGLAVLDLDRMSPENRRAYDVFYIVGDSIPVEEHNRYHLVYMRKLLQLDETATVDQINAELVRRGWDPMD